MEAQGETRRRSEGFGVGSGSGSAERHRRRRTRRLGLWHHRREFDVVLLPSPRPKYVLLLWPPLELNQPPSCQKQCAACFSSAQKVDGSAYLRGFWLSYSYTMNWFLFAKRSYPFPCFSSQSLLLSSDCCSGRRTFFLFWSLFELQWPKMLTAHRPWSSEYVCITFGIL